LTAEINKNITSVQKKASDELMVVTEIEENDGPSYGSR
jgi:hypothetical protein